MTAPVLFVVSTDNPMPAVFRRPQEAGLIGPVRQDRLTEPMLMAAAGLITCVSVDQLDLLERRSMLESFLDRGGRWVVNGHVLRPWIAGLASFVPLRQPKRSDYALARLVEHPVFAGIPASALEMNRGVAGFYGRGHNPPPAGALAITGLGPSLVPVDWEWRRPTGGALFVHSGNDLWGVGDDPEVKRLIAERLVAWCLAREDAA